ncbi:enkurin isoform X1 [Pleuronectes platessa]|uniref:enkurin isoform X1 n=1 Tax=Pleuronectes platessa TaxID=8262 RepID=UPI00232A771F|nr:enkurin isoform X1 [Pleuronectes platessa]
MSEVVYPPESVYNCLPKTEVLTQKPSRYMSKFRQTVILEEKANKETMRTMGPAKVEVASPDQYTKKHLKEPKLAKKTHPSKEFCHSCTVKKPPVPARTDNPPLGIHTKRDFIKTTTLVPMKPQPTCVDSKGHKQRLENSGLVPKYLKKKDYGEVPEYLIQRNEEKQRDQEDYENFVKDQKEQGAIKLMSDMERQALLADLKKNWDKLHHEYQGLSLVTDTLSKKAHKEKLEAAMKQLEEDIDLFEKFKTIYLPNH